MVAYNRRLVDKPHRNLESRVSAVETGLEHIESSMADIKESIKAGFHDLRRELDQQEQDSKPKLASWAGWAAVVLVIIGMFGSGYVRDLNRIEAQQVLLDQRLRYSEREAAVEQALRDQRNLEKYGSK